MRRNIKPVIPDAFYGTTSVMATHQTLAGNIIATEDPKALYHALFYWSLCKELLKLNRNEIPESFQKTADYFR